MAGRRDPAAGGNRPRLIRSFVTSATPAQAGPIAMSSTVRMPEGGVSRQDVPPDPTILVADDHAPTRSLVRTSLESGGFVVKGEAPDAASAVALAQAQHPDLALLDVRMPGSGIAAAAAILAERPEMVVVMLTVSEDDEDLFAALRVGARGYILKGGDPGDLPDALRRTLAGEAVLPGALLARVLARVPGGRAGTSIRPVAARAAQRERSRCSSSSNVGRRRPRSRPSSSSPK